MTSARDGTVLVIDDSVESLATLNALLRPQHRVLAATSGAAGLRLAQSQPRPDLILLDVLMPGMDGYTVLQHLRQEPACADIPVIFLTALGSAEEEGRGLELGAADYITKPVRPAVLRARVRSQLQAKWARDWMRDQNATLDAEVARRLTENDLTQQITIRALAHLAEIRDPETGNHILRTQRYVQELALRLRHHPRFESVLTDRTIELLARSAPLHDIGKVGIPDHILLKPGRLDAAEMAVMRTHAELGWRAIEKSEHDVAVKLPFLAVAKEIAHWHHEHWDGSGYPDGLVGEQIPVSARLMAVADVFDALISPRVYKSAMAFERAREIMAKGRGAQFDPDIVDAFLEGYEAFVGIAERHVDSDTLPPPPSVPQAAAPFASAGSPQDGA